MSIIIFIIALAVLILVHELGHFVSAKISKIRVDEFGIGFPPKLFAYKPKKSETSYSVNIIPFGGFVKIFGEEATAESIGGKDSERSFINKSKWTQVWVLSAGVIFNWLLAWVFISVAFMIGVPTAIDEADIISVENPRVAILSVLPDSPADLAGFMAGDELLGLKNKDKVLALAGLEHPVERTQEFIKESFEGLTIEYKRDGQVFNATVLPESGIVDDSLAIGVSLGFVGDKRLPIHKAIYDGAIFTGRITGLTAVGLYDFVSDALFGKADFSQVAGPVGIVGLVGDAASLGVSQLLTFIAFISINLAIINLIPFPALDGGRILFVLIEWVKGSAIKPKIANALNLIGFFALIILMLVITYSDIAKLVN